MLPDKRPLRLSSSPPVFGPACVCQDLLPGLFLLESAELSPRSDTIWHQAGLPTLASVFASVKEAHFPAHTDRVTAADHGARHPPCLTDPDPLPDAGLPSRHRCALVPPVTPQP